MQIAKWECLVVLFTVFSANIAFTQEIDETPEPVIDDCDPLKCWTASSVISCYTEMGATWNDFDGGSCGNGTEGCDTEPLPGGGTQLVCKPGHPDSMRSKVGQAAWNEDRIRYREVTGQEVGKKCLEKRSHRCATEIACQCVVVGQTSGCGGDATSPVAPPINQPDPNQYTYMILNYDATCP
jgi:hypothetical protein